MRDVTREELDGVVDALAKVLIERGIRPLVDEYVIGSVHRDIWLAIARRAEEQAEIYEGR